MKLLQQDDIQDSINEQSKRKFRFTHIPTSKFVRAKNKSEAVKLFLEIHKITIIRKDVK